MPTSTASPPATATTWSSARRATRTSATSDSTSRRARRRHRRPWRSCGPTAPSPPRPTICVFPNGSVITDDGSTLIVGESMGARFTAFTITHDRGLTDRRVWAEVPGMAPDGCTIDADGAIWFADARRIAGGPGARRRRDHRSGADSRQRVRLHARRRRRSHAVRAHGRRSHPDMVAGTATGALWQRQVDVPRTPTSRP